MLQISRSQFPATLLRRLSVPLFHEHEQAMARSPGLGLPRCEPEWQRKRNNAGTHVVPSLINAAWIVRRRALNSRGPAYLTYALGGGITPHNHACRTCLAERASATISPRNMAEPPTRPAGCTRRRFAHRSTFAGSSGSAVPRARCLQTQLRFGGGVYTCVQPELYAGLTMP